MYESIMAFQARIRAMTAPARYRLYALGALASLPYLAMGYFARAHGYHLRSLLALGVTAALGLLLLAGCTRTWRRFFLAHFLLLLPAIAYAAYALGFSVVPGRVLGILMLSASWEEMRGLWMLWQGKWLLVPLGAALAAYLYLAWGVPDWPIFSGKAYLGARALLVLALPVAAYAATDAAQLIDGIALNPVAGSLMFIVGQLPRARAEMRGEGIHKIPYHARRDSSAEEVHVLIVGESARRNSWSVYGYERATTPYLERIKGEAIVLARARADANLTQLAVPMILTGIAPENLATTNVHGNLFDAAREAGYVTSWLVNQDIEVSTSIGITADHLDYPPDMRPGLFGRHTPDDVLLPLYRRELARAGQPRLIGMHIMESHWEYYRRYPPSFQRFGHANQLNSMSILASGGSAGAAIIDAYDNSTLYADWFIGQVIEAARALAVPVSVTFIPDHGESLSDFDAGIGGHGGPVYSAAEFEIPAFVWVNAPYRSAHPREVAALESNAAKEIHSHDFFYTLADLMGITWPQAQPEHSLASERFVPDTARAVLVGGVLQERP